MAITLECYKASSSQHNALLRLINNFFDDVGVLRWFIYDLTWCFEATMMNSVDSRDGGKRVF